MELRPHDLIRINSINDLLKGHLFPLWANVALAAVPYVVIRRAAHDSRIIPVGIRGKHRGQRRASWLSADDISEIITPELLSLPANWKINPKDIISRQMSSLLNVSPLLEMSGYQWGPTGSVAFELATGMKTTNESSDLDLIIRSAELINKSYTSDLLNELDKLSLCPLDIQVNTPAGGFALKEYCYSSTVLLKTVEGPFLIKSSEIWGSVSKFG